MGLERDLKGSGSVLRDKRFSEPPREITSPGIYAGCLKPKTNGALAQTKLYFGLNPTTSRLRFHSTGVSLKLRSRTGAIGFKEEPPLAILKTPMGVSNRRNNVFFAIIILKSLKFLF